MDHNPVHPSLSFIILQLTFIDHSVIKLGYVKLEEKTLHRAWLSTGSNLSDPVNRLAIAEDLLSERCGKIILRSPVYKTEAWGFESDYPFFNQCLCLQTTLSPENLMKELLAIEKDLGRERNGTGYSDRVIDIDLLYYDELVSKNEGLTLPHPRLHKRRFVLVPLADIAPELIDPRSGMRVWEMLSICRDDSKVQRIR